MNEKLSFTWGHIIAFLALIALGYFTYVGTTYYTGGNFIVAGIFTALILIATIALFFSLQKLKFTNRKMGKRIKIERVLLFASPVLFLVLMLPTEHFFTVHDRNDAVVSNFTNAISGSKGLFSDYEQYAEKRILDYETHLTEIADSHDSLYDVVGFERGQERALIENGVATLRRQLLADFDTLQTSAEEWIDKANNGASIWNVFLMGNTQEIMSAIYGWQSQLEGFAKHRMSDEEKLPSWEGPISESESNYISDFYSPEAGIAIDEIANLRSSFTETGWPGFKFLLTFILLYGALLLPWVLQDRHTKNPYRIFGTEKDRNVASTAAAQFDDTEHDDTPSPKKHKTAKTSTSAREHSEYQSF